MRPDDCLITSPTERRFVNSLRAALKTLIRSISREHANSSSLLIKYHITNLEMLHDELQELMAAYDANRSCGRYESSLSLERLKQIPLELIQTRIQRGISFDQLSTLTGISRMTLMRYERDKYQKAPLKNMRLILDVLRPSE